jgi:hypothetical protein
MKSSTKPLLALVVALAAGSSSLVAYAEDGPLSKSDVEAIAATKKMVYVRDSDKKEVEFSLRDGRSFYSMSTQGGRNINMTGNYEITDDGKICFKWQPDRYVNIPDGCFAFRREGDKVIVAGGKNPNGRLGEMVK